MDPQTTTCITDEQLLKAKILYEAAHPDAVREEIMQKRPRLLDKPDEDKSSLLDFPSRYRWSGSTEKV